MRKTPFARTLAFVALLATTPAIAATKAMPPGFPIYPHATDPIPETPQTAAYVTGQYVRQSHDSQATIDAWYRAKLPASCQRVPLSSQGVTAIEYRCRAMRVFVDIVPGSDRSGTIDIHAYTL